MEHAYIIAHADKAVMKISGLEVKGLNTVQLEQILTEKLKTFVRVIGVTGDHVEMDLYNIEPERVRRDAAGIIKSVALAEGITVTDVTTMSCSDRILQVDFSEIPEQPISDCPMERWLTKR